jgi:hypothetical protein
MFPYELDAVFEQLFSQKAASAAAGAVEIDIFADLTISKSQKFIRQPVFG